MVPQLQLTVNTFMQKALIEKRELPILAAVSGGVDSMVLMYLLNDFCKQYGRPFAVVHVNHGLRETANRDEQIVTNACLQMGVPLYCRHLGDELHHAGNESGNEAKARSFRYRAIFEAAKEFGTTCIALAHHGEDQIETFLWRYLRGTSVSGLAGIRPITERDGFLLLRPLLSASKGNLLDYATKNQIKYGFDETNNDMRYTRNYLRHQVIPHLRHVQPDLNEVTQRVTEILREEDALLHHMAKEVIGTTVENHHGFYRFYIPAWRDVALPLQRRAIHILLYCFASAKWGYSHVEAILQLISNSHPSATVSLPEGISAWREYDFMCIGRHGVMPERILQNSWDLANESVFSFGTLNDHAFWMFTCEPWMKGHSIRTNTMYELHIPAYQSLIIKSAKTSTRMQPIGLHGTKKIQDIFTDKKIPKSLRTSWPAVYSGENLLWLPGLARAEFGKLDADSEFGWRITAKPPNDLNEMMDMSVADKT